MIDVLLPAKLNDKHRAIILAYLQRGHSFQRGEWREAITAFDLLKNAAVLSPQGLLPFPMVYRRQVEERFADAFIEALYNAPEPDTLGNALWADAARKIMPVLQAAGLLRHDVPATNLLLAYCLYWWRSFTQGYTLEISIQRDLQRSGVRFEAHDLRRRQERLSPYDIAVLGFRGDIKTSLYFLQAARSRDFVYDFIITQIQGRERARTMVVMMQADMWRVLDGDTLLVLLENLADTLPQAARIQHQGIELIIIEYESWKDRVRVHQTSQGD